MAPPPSSPRTNRTAPTGPARGADAHDEFRARDRVEVLIEPNIWAVGFVVAVLRVANQLFGVRYEVRYESPSGGRPTRTFNADEVRRPGARSDGGGDVE